MSEQVKECMDLEHCLHWLYLEPTHLETARNDQQGMAHTQSHWWYFRSSLQGTSRSASCCFGQC
jgi:hypothetical protein